MKYEPLIQVRSTYAANAAVFPSSEGSPVDDGHCNSCHTVGIAKTGNVVMAMMRRSRCRTSGVSSVSYAALSPSR